MEYTIKQLMKKWNLSKSGVIKRIKREEYYVEKRIATIEQKQLIDYVTIEED